ncbi:MAG: quinol:electron acceptor oxidoreductase subunit ActD [Planctomycetota bacterium]|jgi:molybdopterin-containing oxidoreductase family membrane subunit
MMDVATRETLVHGEPNYHEVTQKVCGMLDRRPPKWWLPAFLFAGSVATMGLCLIIYQIVTGVGVWGLNNPVGWAWDITNFVFWVGIGHAGTLISAILLLLRQKWRMSINRAAEAMTLFAVACAGIFPLIHVGRIWCVHFLAPIPNHLGIWPNMKSPLLWDVFAISTYAIVSLLFWYVGLIPDLATLRDRARTKRMQVIYGIFALGWRSGQRSWQHYEKACLLLAGLATPLVLSVHTIVSFDFATSVIPGWHTTIFPPYFVAGAIFSGFAMVITLLVPVRKLYKLESVITLKHLDNMAKVILATGLMVGLAYGTEFFVAWYSGNPFESFVFFESRMQGPYAWAYWTMITCNVLVPQLLWSKKFRRSPWLLFGISLLVNVGMWFERFVIIVTSLAADLLPGSWGLFHATWVDILTFVGTFGIFTSLFLLFLRFFPVIPMHEIKHILPKNATSPDDGAPDEEPYSVPEPVREAQETAGIVAEFPDEDALKKGAMVLRDQGFSRFDAHSPYPIHGMGAAMGQSRSSLGRWTLGGAVFGLLLAVTMTYFPSAQFYPLTVAGKPYNAWPAFIPIYFELAVLCAAFGTLAGLFKLGKLVDWYHPTLKNERFARVTDDRFMLAVDARDPQFDVKRTALLLRDAGGQRVTLLEV